MAHPVLRCETASGEDALNLVCYVLATQLLFQLELDDVAIGIVGKIERGINHVAIDGENGRIRLAKMGSIVLVPYLAGYGYHLLLELSDVGVGVVVEPVPGVHVYECHSHDFITSPKDVKGFEGLCLRIVVVIAQKGKVAPLEDEGQCLSESGVGHSFHDVVVHVVEGDGLLDVVAKLVDGNIVALVVHTVRGDAGAQPGIVGAHVALPGVAGTPRGVNGDVGADELNALGGETELTEYGWHTFLGKCLAVGIEAAGQGGEVILIDGAAGLEPVVPDVEGLQFAPHSVADKGCHVGHLRRSKEGGEELLNLVVTDLHVLIKGTVYSGGIAGVVAVHLLHGMEVGEEMVVASVRLALGVV